ncbi:MAG: DNA repair protein RecN, partial [Clostridiales bacterium]|nr:DNA repair protein RecN [Clostridiales bacterium]
IEKQLLFGFTSEQERLQKIDILAYQINEIANARLIEGEEEQLDAQLRVLSNSQHIQTALEQSYDTLANEEGALVAISGARRTVQGIGALHEKFQEIYDRLDEAYYTIEDIIYTLRDLKNGNEYMPGQLEEVENRLAVIHALKRKYGANIAEILAFHENANMEHEALVKSEELKGALTAQLRTCQAQYTIAAAALSAARKEAATVLEQDILRQFADLGMEKSQFQVAITPLPSPSADGVDRVEFLLSANAGEPVKPLAKIASGGEISRIMLAFKTIQFGSIPSIIFDEIDTGISGHVASAVGLKMLQISKGHQVICITHLPQIAALADAHYYVEKIEKDGHTSTVLHTLTDEQRVTELARIMGAGRHDVQAMNHAAELIQRANSLKEKY